MKDITQAIVDRLSADPVVQAVFSDRIFDDWNEAGTAMPGLLVMQVWGDWDNELPKVDLLFHIEIRCENVGQLQEGIKALVANLNGAVFDTPDHRVQRSYLSRGPVGVEENIARAVFDHDVQAIRKY